MDTETARRERISLDDLCNALYTSARNNDLPVPFFANLIWQESRLHYDSRQPDGALGIAQFMPEVAVEVGLDDPFDPLQAIPPRPVSSTIFASNSAISDLWLPPTMPARIAF